MSVATEQNTLKNLHLEIGKKVHEIYQYGGSLGKFFDEKYREIEACEIKIEELKEQISLIKGTRECSKCGKSAERTAEFCPKCGIRLAAASETDIPQAHAHAHHVDYETPTPQYDIEVDTPQFSHQVEAPVPSAPMLVAPAPAPQTQVDPPKTTRHCRVCGMENDITTKFCLSCGRIVD